MDRLFKGIQLTEPLTSDQTAPHDNYQPYHHDGQDDQDHEHVVAEDRSHDRRSESASEISPERINIECSLEHHNNEDYEGLNEVIGLSLHDVDDDEDESCKQDDAFEDVCDQQSGA